MNSLSDMNCVQLMDLPDELLLIIMNKIQPKALMLCSIVGIGNNRLEKLAVDMCYSIDVTFDYPDSINQFLIPRFYIHVLPLIINNIQLLTISTLHIRNMTILIEKCSNGILSKLTHLKITRNKQNSLTGITCYPLGNNLYAFPRNFELFSDVPQIHVVDKSIIAREVSTFLRLLSVPSMISFELDEDLILTNILNDNGLFFSESIHLTDIRITLFELGHLICLLDQIGSQLCSLKVNMLFDLNMNVPITKMKSISCSNLKKLEMINYRNMRHYQREFLPLLQRLSNVEYLILLLAVGLKGKESKDFIDGFDLDKDIISYMPHLRQFHFHIRSIISNVIHVDINTIRQSFPPQQESFDCSIDYFNNNHSQCQIYSLPFPGIRLDFISNRFPLFHTTQIFRMITILLLFDDIQSFEYHFFERISRSLPHLRSLDVMNYLGQQEKTETITNLIEFPHLTTLILFDIHLDYAEQLLCRSHLPSLNELAIDNDILLKIIAQDQQQAKDNCSQVRILRTSDPFYHSIDTLENLFPPNSYCKHPKESKI